MSKVGTPLYMSPEVLDGRDTRDYVQRVEPSPQGGRKMAVALLEAIYGGGNGGSDEDSGGSGAHDGYGAEDGLVLRRPSGMRRE